MAKKPFINKYGFVEYPFLHDTRKGKNWWFWNLLEDYLRRRARQKVGNEFTKEDMDKDFKQYFEESTVGVQGSAVIVQTRVSAGMITKIFNLGDIDSIVAIPPLPTKKKE